MNNRGYDALAEIETHLAFKAALFDTSNDGASLPPPPANLGRCFRPMAAVEARAVCASYNEHLRRWRDTDQDHWPLATRIGSGRKAVLCFKLRTGFPRTCWMYDGGALIKFSGRFDSHYHPCDGALTDRFLANPDHIKWAGWYRRKGRGQ